LTENVFKHISANCLAKAFAGEDKELNQSRVKIRIKSSRS